MKLTLVLLLAAAWCISTCVAFVPASSARVAVFRSQHATTARQHARRLQSSQDPQTSTEQKDVTASSTEGEPEASKELVPMDMSLPTINLDQLKADGKDYPIDFPAYGLLSLSCVVAIAFIGSIFEVAGPSPLVSETIQYDYPCCESVCAKVYVAQWYQACRWPQICNEHCINLQSADVATIAAATTLHVNHNKHFNKT
jgi:hypothetical protein